MKISNRTTIIEVEGVKYQLSKLDARSASYLAFKSAGVIAPLIGKKGKDGKELTVDEFASVLPAIPRQEFDEIQNMLLKTVSKMNEVNGQLLPEIILKKDGSFVDEELAYDTTTVITLTVRAFLFNVGGFFTGAGLTPAKKKAPA